MATLKGARRPAMRPMDMEDSILRAMMQWSDSLCGRHGEPRASASAWDRLYLYLILTPSRAGQGCRTWSATNHNVTPRVCYHKCIADKSQRNLPRMEGLARLSLLQTDLKSKVEAGGQSVVQGPVATFYDRLHARAVAKRLLTDIAGFRSECSQGPWIVKIRM